MADETAVSQVGGTLLDKIVDFIIPLQVVTFLNTTLIRISFFVLNYWSFIHFGSGILFFLMFSHSFKLWFWVNIVFEIVEYILGLGGNPLFVEEFVDIVWDIIFSILGFWVMAIVFPKLSKDQKNKLTVFTNVKNFFKGINR